MPFRDANFGEGLDAPMMSAPGSLGRRPHHQHQRPVGDQNTGRAHHALHDAAAPLPRPPDDYIASATRDAITTLSEAFAVAHLGPGNRTHPAQDISIDTGLPVFSCNPYNPCQRGTNEHKDEPLRQYFPKDTDLSAHSNVEEEQAHTSRVTTTT